MTDLNSIVEDLRALPAEKLVEAAAYIQQLKTAAGADRKAALDRAYGSLTEAESTQLAAAIAACRARPAL